MPWSPAKAPAADQRGRRLMTIGYASVARFATRSTACRLNRSPLACSVGTDLRSSRLGASPVAACNSSRGHHHRQALAETEPRILRRRGRPSSEPPPRVQARRRTSGRPEGSPPFQSSLRARIRDVRRMIWAGRRPRSRGRSGSGVTKPRASYRDARRPCACAQLGGGKERRRSLRRRRSRRGSL